MKKSRAEKSALNAKVNLIFYSIILVVSFYSRKIFLESLGDDFVGLTSTLQNILSLLNIAELGIGAAIGFNLYKPIQENDKEKINELISLFGWLYRYIGLFILILGVLVSCFFPLFFSEVNFSYPIIYFAFYSFLASSLIGYFVNYRTLLLTADQKNYIVFSYHQSANVIKILFQIGVCYYYKSYYLWILLELTFGIIESIILNIKINKEYKWINTKIKKGSLLNNKYPNIRKSTKQIFVHKLKDFLLSESDQIFVFVFVSLKMVAYYGNYILIISKLTVLFDTTLSGVKASVGNLVAEGDIKKITSVFWELMSLRYLIAGITTVSLFFFINPFISLWLGHEYLLDNTILILLLINTFIILSRGAVDDFNYAYGHYSDIWSAWTEGAINICITLISAPFWGIPGILLGKIISLIPIIVLWKPYYLFRDGFKLKIRIYWKNTIFYYISFILSLSIILIIHHFIPISPYLNWFQFFKYLCILIPLYITIYGLIMLSLAPGTGKLLTRVVKQLKKK